MTTTQENLKEAFAGESQAYQKYSAFAKKAEQEGFPTVARLFRQWGATVIDGYEGMEGNGPIQGKRKAAGVLVGGSDRVAVDATCCRIMGIDPAKIGHLKMAETQAQTLEDLPLREIDPFRRPH